MSAPGATLASKARRRASLTSALVSSFDMLSPPPSRPEDPHIVLLLNLGHDHNQREARFRGDFHADAPASIFVPKPPIVVKVPKPDRIADFDVARSVLFIGDLGLHIRMGRELHNPWSMVGHLWAWLSRGLFSEGRTDTS